MVVYGINSEKKGKNYYFDSLGKMNGSECNSTNVAKTIRHLKRKQNDVRGRHVSSNSSRKLSLSI